MPDPQPSVDNRPAVSERRSSQRLRITSLIYVDLGRANGGVARDIGEGGLALTTAGILGLDEPSDQLLNMRIHLPGSVEGLEANGQVAWSSKSGTHTGVKFVGLGAEARERIRDWIAAQASETGFQPNESEPPKAEQRISEVMIYAPAPEFFAPAFETSRLEPEEETNSLNPGEAVQESATPASESLEFGTFVDVKKVMASVFEKFAFPEAAPKEEGREPAPPPPRDMGVVAPAPNPRLKTSPKKVASRPVRVRRQEHPEPRRGLARIVFAGAAILLMAVGVRVATQHVRFSDEVGSITKRTANPAKSSESKPKGELVAKTIPTDTPLQRIQVPTQPLQTRTASSVTQNATPAAGVPLKENAKEIVRGDKSPVPAPRSNTAQRGVNRPELSTRTTRQSPQSTQYTQEAIPNVPPLVPKDKPMQTGEVPPTQNKDLNLPSSPAESSPASSPVSARISSSVNRDAAIVPALAAAVDPIKEKSSSTPAPAPKQPEAVVTRTTLVTVSADPFPSIRMPKSSKDKKSRSGKSLQMGHLVVRADPIYPEEAKLEGIEGPVRVHVIFNRDGTVQGLVGVSGPPLLARAAMDAVRQWRYTETLVDGKAMETEEDVAVLLRLENSSSKK